MWSAILGVPGWVLYYSFLLFYVRWIPIERASFASQEPARAEPKLLSQTPPTDQADLQLAA